MAAQRLSPEQQSCQSCHMPVVAGGDAGRVGARRAAGRPRRATCSSAATSSCCGCSTGIVSTSASQALPRELDASALRTVRNLQQQTRQPCRSNGRSWRADGLNFDVAVQNLTGHKFPTGYPARRAWLHVTVRDRTRRRRVRIRRDHRRAARFEGNDNDADAPKFEPHYAEIREPDQVQIYESIMSDPAGRPTTGLLSAVRYLKDNRLLPRGFDKATAEPFVQVVGSASQDTNFTGGGDRVRYSVNVGDAQGPFQVDVELRFQPIGFRWAQNLKPYDAAEPKRFVSYYDSMSAGASEVVAQTRLRSR